MSNQSIYNTHRANGVPHDEAIIALGVNAATARTLKSRHSKTVTIEQLIKDDEREVAKHRRKAKPAPKVVDAVKVYNTQAELTRLAYETQSTGIAVPVPTVPTFQMPNLQAARNAAVSLLLIGVVIGHTGLVWFDCADRWSVPGAIGGGVVFLIVLAALLLASDETKPRTSEAALWFVFITDFAAWFVHFPVFRDRAQIGDIETGVFAGFLCAASFTALYLYRDSRLD